MHDHGESRDGDVGASLVGQRDRSCTPSVNVVVGRLRAVSWNTAPLFGGMSSGPRRSHSKRRMVESSFVAHALVLLQETRGKTVGMVALPCDSVWMCPLPCERLRHFVARGRGGVVHPAQDCRVDWCCHGRDLGHGDESMDLINIHLGQGMGLGARVYFLHSVREFFSEGEARTTSLGRGWNFLATVEHRLDLERGERREGSRTLAAFEAMFGDLTECAQSQHAFSQGFEGGANVVYSRGGTPTSIRNRWAECRYRWQSSARCYKLAAPPTTCPSVALRGSARRSAGHCPTRLSASRSTTGSRAALRTC